MNETIINRFEYISKIILYIVVALIPVWFVPLSIDVEQGREVTFSVLVILAAIFWLTSVLIKGEFRFQQSPILYTVGLLLIAFVASTLLSKAPAVSALFAVVLGQRFSSILIGIVLMLVFGGVMRSMKDIATPVFLLMLFGGIGGIITLFQYYGWSPYQFSFVQNYLGFSGGADFNVIGTVNALSLFYVVLLAMGLGLTLSKEFSEWKKVARWWLWIANIIFFLNILVVNYRNAWILLLGVGIFLFGIVFRRGRAALDHALAVGETPVWASWRYWVSVGLLVVCALMLVIKNPLSRSDSFPAEVIPTYASTFAITKSVFQEGPRAVFFGTGPGTFGLNWSKYRDSSLNQTVFWNVRFNQGASWVATLLPSVGVFGFLSFLLLLGFGLFLFLRFFILSEEHAAASALMLGFVALLFAAFLYPVNYALLVLFFFFMGALSLFFASPIEQTGAAELHIGEQGRWRRFFAPEHFWTIQNRTITFAAPWASFTLSLVCIFVFTLFVASLHTAFGRVRAVLLQADAVKTFQAGNIDASIEKFEQAAVIENNNYLNYQSLVQLRTEKIRFLIQRASGGENVVQEFQSTVSTAIQNSQRGIELFGAEPFLWRTQGALYELIIPFIQGSERFAFESYQRAIELDSTNPSLYVDLGRAGLVYADRLQIQLDQAFGAERNALEKERATALENVVGVLQKAAELKNDLALAHFMLAQTAIRTGNIQNAIQSTENAKLAAPFDVGIAFQLGLLHYQTNNLSRAREEFERAVSLNSNYSNARYFLGLIYDRQGNKDGAIEEFEKIETLNPDNQEVKRILQNLRSGRNALSGIVPPAEPPEQRSGTPVGEGR